MENSQSFSSRRLATAQLPPFSLPHPNYDMSKYHNYGPASSAQNVANVLTPPITSQHDLSPINSSSVNSGSSAGSSNMSVPPYQNQPVGGNPQGYWPPQNPNYTFHPPPSVPAPFQNPLNRPLYSPQVNYNNNSNNNSNQRSSNSPSTGELPPPPFDLSHLPPFSIGGGSGGSSNSHTSSYPMAGGTSTYGGHQNGNVLPFRMPGNENGGQSNGNGSPQQQQMQNMMNSRPQSAGPQQANAQSPYGGHPPPTPTYTNYPPSSTPQHYSSSAYTHQSPGHQSPITSGPPQNRISPVSSQHPPMQPPQGQYARPSYGYGLPALQNPVMSNMHQPGSQMALVGINGMNMGQYPGQHMGQQMYNSHQGQQQPPSDRPFKCDQCPQSFNRNHDLKRHKRIHLAVKPFPCAFCDKSFSRKDALKRHILVKGCGNKTKDAEEEADNDSPVDKSEIMSDDAEDDDGSPQMGKKNN